VAETNRRATVGRDLSPAEEVASARSRVGRPPTVGADGAVNLRMPVAMVERLHELAKKWELPYSVLVRAWIAQGLDSAAEAEFLEELFQPPAPELLRDKARRISKGR